MTKKQRAAIIIERLREAYPDATCTLEYDEAWKLLVEVRLAAQCTDARVNIVVQDLYAKYQWQHLLRRSQRMWRQSCVRVDLEEARRRIFAHA